jgi:Tol biopolymer transport system component
VAAEDGGTTAVWAKAVDAASAPEKLVEMPLLGSADLAPDGRTLAVTALQGNVWRVIRVPLDSPSTVTPYNASDGQQFVPRISPDGRWVAHTSSATGAFEVYVRSYPVPTVAVQVSVGGGGAPVWSADGTVLYYSSGNAIIAAKLATGAGLRVVSRDTAFANVNLANPGFANYDVVKDGSRMIIPVVPTVGYQLVVTPNWRTELRERVDASRK